MTSRIKFPDMKMNRVRLIMDLSLDNGYADENFVETHMRELHRETIEGFEDYIIHKDDVKLRGTIVSPNVMRSVDRRLRLLWGDDIPPPVKKKSAGKSKWAEEKVRESPNASISEVMREQLIREHLSSQEGRERLAEAMVRPIRSRMDYTAVGRRTFLVERLPDGALPVYDRDIDVRDVVLNPSAETE